MAYRSPKPNPNPNPTQKQLQTKNKLYYNKNKKNTVYIILVGEMFYYGHTSMPLARRKAYHMYAAKHGCSNPRMHELFKELGEQEFRKRFKVISLGTFNTKAEARNVEKILLDLYVGKPNCMNINKGVT